ncbi:MAG: ABC transporter permease [Thermomicrobiales bacterium]|nr:ABC transporter permease [Thermomicrobiales bacterium]
MTTPSTTSQPAGLTALATPPVETNRRTASNAGRAWRRFRANQLAMAALIVTILLVLLAAGAPLISEYVTHVGPNKQSLIKRFQGGSGDHWLGTDEYGRDVVTRLIYGLRVSLGVAALATIVTLVVGTLTGAAAAYYGGLTDQILMRVVDILMSIPGINVLILFGALFTVGPAGMAVMIAFISWYPLARLIRSEVLSIRRREYIEAARVMGTPGHSIILRHILPNITHLIVVFAIGAIPGYILAEAGMSFLGLGIRAPTPSLGNMLNGSTTYLYKRPELILYPGLVITLIALMISIVGNALRDALDPRLNG